MLAEFLLAALCLFCGGFGLRAEASLAFLGSLRRCVKTRLQIFYMTPLGLGIRPGFLRSRLKPLAQVARAAPLLFKKPLELLHTALVDNNFLDFLFDYLLDRHFLYDELFDNALDRDLDELFDDLLDRDLDDFLDLDRDFHLDNTLDDLRRRLIFRRGRGWRGRRGRRLLPGCGFLLGGAFLLRRGLRRLFLLRRGGRGRLGRFKRRAHFNHPRGHWQAAGREKRLGSRFVEWSALAPIADIYGKTHVKKGDILHLLPDIPVT